MVSTLRSLEGGPIGTIHNVRVGDFRSDRCGTSSSRRLQLRLVPIHELGWRSNPGRDHPIGCQGSTSPLRSELQAMAEEIDSNLEPEVERQRAKLLARISESNVSNVTQRVAWILNYFPEARSSDVTLMLRYWETFEYSYHRGSTVSPEDLYRYPRLTTLSRARATIQNKFRLFLGTEDVQRRRRQLDEAQRELVRQEQPSYPVMAVYADESGKRDKNLVVGSVWILDHMSTLQLFHSLNATKEKYKFDGELHFRHVNDRTLPVFLDSVAVLRKHANSLSFRAVLLPRIGISNVQQALQDMFYHLLASGVKREVSTERAPLPRMLQFTKDAEEKGADQLALANIEDRIRSFAAFELNKELSIDRLTALPSDSNAFLQMADLFTSSIHRRVNVDRSGSNAKDRLAQAIYESFELSEGETDFGEYRDAVSITSI